MSEKPAEAFVRSTRFACAGTLGALSALHFYWATGGAWPAADRSELADAVGGFRTFPSPAACVSVAGLLAIASLSVAGLPRSSASRIGSGCASAALLARATIGFSGLMPNGEYSERFRHLNRAAYSPLCLVLGAMAMAGALRDQT